MMVSRRPPTSSVTRIFLEREEERLAFDLDFFGVECLLGDGGLVTRTAVGGTGGGWMIMQNISHGLLRKSLGGAMSLIRPRGGIVNP